MQSLCEHRDFPEPWRRDPFDRSGAIDTLMDELAQLGTWQPRVRGPTITSPAISPRLPASSKRRPGSRRSAVATMTGSRRSSAVSYGAGAGAGKVPSERPSVALSRDEVLARRDQAKADLEAFIAAMRCGSRAAASRSSAGADCGL